MSGSQRTNAPARHAAIAMLLASCVVIGFHTADERFSHAPGIPPELSLQFTIDPNTASAEELELLPRIGPTLSARIVEYRKSKPAPAFSTPNDLKRIKGIGPYTIQQVRTYLRFPDPKESKP